MSLVDKKDATPYPLCCNGFRLFYAADGSFRGKESDRAGAYYTPALSDSFHRSEEHTAELQSLSTISDAGFCV